MRNQESEKLYNLIKEYTDWYQGGKQSMSANAIYNALWRGGVYTIDDLKNAEPERIQRIRTIGNGVRFGLIMTMKLSLEEESC